jgi:hypothetical protein
VKLPKKAQTQQQAAEQVRQAATQATQANLGREDGRREVLLERDLLVRSCA